MHPMHPPPPDWNDCIWEEETSESKHDTAARRPKQRIEHKEKCQKQRRKMAGQLGEASGRCLQSASQIVYQNSINVDFEGLGQVYLFSGVLQSIQMSEFSAHVSSGGTTRRTSAASARRGSVAGPLHADIDAPPKPWPFAPFIAVGVIVFFFCLQLLPATHYRDPFDPHRQWKPISPDASSASASTGLADISKQAESLQRVHIFSWTDDFDLRPLAVLVNSTIQNSGISELIYFHLFLPHGPDEEDSYHKLKALFPKSNIEMISHNTIREKVKIVTSDAEHDISKFRDVFPFYIPKIFTTVHRFIYVAPDIIMKDKVEELFRIDLKNFSVAAVEDCSQSYGSYMNFEIINAIQRSGARPWVAKNPYEKNRCILDLDVLLIDAESLTKQNLTEVVIWWAEVLHTEGDRGSQSIPAILLALYGKYMKLDAAWNIRESEFSGLDDGIKILHYDREKKPWLNQVEENLHKGVDRFWWHYLSPVANQLLKQPTVS